MSASQNVSTPIKVCAATPTLPRPFHLRCGTTSSMALELRKMWHTPVSMWGSVRAFSNHTVFTGKCMLYVCRYGDVHLAYLCRQVTALHLPPSSAPGCCVQSSSVIVENTRFKHHFYKLLFADHSVSILVRFTDHVLF